MGPEHPTERVAGDFEVGAFFLAHKLSGTRVSGEKKALAEGAARD